jgi:hypothetical protein
MVIDSVIDRVSIELHDERIRLFGIGRRGEAQIS